MGAGRGLAAGGARWRAESAGKADPAPGGEPLTRWLRRCRPSYPRPGRRGVWRWIPSWRQLLGLFGLLLLSLIGFMAVVYARTEIPQDLNAFATQQDNVYYWADGTEMARTGQTHRQETSLDKVPDAVQWAVLAAENESFYADRGVSVTGMLRAAKNMLTGGGLQGGSTITQQYVKNVYLSQRQTFSRKLSEVFIAMKLDRKFSKHDILEGYLNTSWFGRGSYGIQRAAYAYYRKDVRELNPSEGAFLAAVLKGGNAYDPLVSRANRKRAEQRWSWVLDRMVTIGKLSARQRATYRTFPEPEPAPKPDGMAGQAGYLVQTAQAYVLAHTGVSHAEFAHGGYQIRTTFEKPSVEALTDAVARARGRLDPSRRTTDRSVRVGAASVAPDGRMVALYGGPGYLEQGFNDADAATVPVGTAFAPIVYAAALQNGVQRERDGPRTRVTPSTVYDGDDDLVLRTPEGPYWDRAGKMLRTGNEGRKSYGDVTLREAVARSVTSAVTQLGMDTGLAQVRRTARAVGLLPSSIGRQTPAFLRGNSTPSAIRMASAYATFPARGSHVEPYSVSRLSRQGDAVPLPDRTPEQALSTEVAADVDAALRDAVHDGAASAARRADPWSAGTPGNTEDHTAAWFVGYTPRLATAVSVSRPTPKGHELQPLDGLAGAHGDGGSAFATDIWSDYLRSLPDD